MAQPEALKLLRSLQTQPENKVRGAAGSVGDTHACRRTLSGCCATATCPCSPLSCHIQSAAHT